MRTPQKRIRSIQAKIVPARFWSKVDVRHPARCWNWTGSKNNGYGHFRVGKQPVHAQRVAWTLTFGAIPRGKVVMHECDNPACVNPAHLRLGTQAENLHDMYTKRRNRGGPREPLTRQQVIEIRQSNKPLRELMIQFDRTQAAIIRIRNKQTYAHI